jgi:hypothetical protein
MLEDLIKGLLSEALEDSGKVKKPIGMISDELRQAYCEWRDEKEELEAEIEFRMERLKRKLEKQLADEFEQKFRDTEEKKDKLWKDIRAELGLIGEKDLNINTKTGVISQWVKEGPSARH